MAERAALPIRMVRWLHGQIAPAETEGGGPFGRFEALALVCVAVGLTLTQFGGAERVFLGWFGDALAADLRAEISDPAIAALVAARDHPFYELLALVHWVAFCVIGYVLIPAVYLKVMGQSIIDNGYLRVGGFTRHIGIYLLLFALVMLPVVIVSFSPEYQSIYPFYTRAGRSVFDLVAWELAYGLQFFALEFMFRGFMLQTLRKWLGYGAVFVMVVPYCMLHFQKTGSESLGAIIAGVILGCLAMNYRSIWGGVLIHWGVAISMDVLSLAHQGLLPTRLWP